MNILVSRTAVEVTIGKPGEDRAERPIEAYAECNAFVLLGEAGAGKSTEFRRVAEETKDGHYVTARNFLALAIRPEWRNRTLFIDALDERRAGSRDRRAPLDEIRSKLDQLDRPRFRISCRSVDWLGLNDQRHLSEVSRNGKVKILYLNPLEDRDVMEILKGANLIPAPKEFVQEAKEYGLGTLLTNPLTLQLLAKSVAEQDWPRTRTEVYLRASRLLVSEQNEEHQLGAGPHISDDQKLHAAGRLFAIQILSGAEGYSISKNDGGSCINISSAQVDDPNVANAVLHSGLFKQGAPGQYVAFHTAIAEFLAGRFLANEVGNGLPAGRVHSLMAGYDGVTLPQFRAVAAWIATHSPKCRRELVSADPIGAMLDGDVATFPVADRIHVLESIDTKSKDNPWFILNVQYDDPRFGSLASADMAAYYARSLGSPSRTDSHQVHAFFLLNVLKHGRPVSEISDVALRVVEDDTWWPKVRIEALRVLIGLPSSNSRRRDVLLNLLRRVDSGEVADIDDRIRGFLLRDLYPEVIGPDQILDYLLRQKGQGLFETYRAYWYPSIAERSTVAQRAVLMDRLTDFFTEGPRILQGHTVGVDPFFDFIESLVTRTIPESGSDVTPHRLFRWLEILTRAELRVSSRALYQVHAWLAKRNELLRQVFECCVDHCLEQANFKHCLDRIEQYLGLAYAPNYAQMCMSAAARIQSHEASLVLEEHARSVLRTTTAQIAQQATDLSPPTKVGGPVALPSDQDQQVVDVVRSQDPSVDSTARNRYEEFKAQEDALLENRCDPATLFRLARIYFGEHPENSAGSPIARLRDSLLDDDELVAAARFGLRNTISRWDLPGVSEFARMFAKGQMHYFALPVLAGIEEIDLDSDLQFGSSGNVCKRLALILHFGMPRMNPDPWRKNSAEERSLPTPAWYDRLARDESAVVAREFVRYARLKLRSRTSLLWEAASLDSEPNYSTIAAIAAAPILRMFPVRTSSSELAVLAKLLGVARRHCDRGEFVAVVQEKLQSRSMSIAQRVYWLTAAFLAEPRTYRSAFEGILGASQLRIRRVVEFLWHWPEGQTSQELFGCLRETDLAYLIEVLGSSHSPEPPYSASENDPSASQALYVDDFMNELIKLLGNCTSREATEALERIRSDESLRPWRFSIGRAADNQRAIRREAEFSYGSADAVCRVLSGREPANSADLAALTVSALKELAERIRNSNTSDWKQYWTGSEDISECRPHNENNCRDALLSDLGASLSNIGIDCQPEPNYLDGKRADIRVAFLGFGIPLEVKKSNHPRVWSSIRSQLIPKYTQDPECDGCGIYVVFWFGREFLQPPPSGRKPSDPKQMREMLIASLEEDERRKIAVVVVDVSRDRTTLH